MENKTNPIPQVIGLRTIDLNGGVGMQSKHTSTRSVKKRVFTDDQWAFLNTRSNEDLLGRIEQGDRLIALLENPQVINMTPAQAATVTSNLKFQQEEIRRIIKGRAIAQGV